MMRVWMLVVLCAAMLAWGCSPETLKGEKDKVPGKGKVEHDDHDHGVGVHGGTIAHWGKKNHIEVCFDRKKKEATVYIFGEEETGPPTPIKAESLTLKIEEPKPGFEVELKAAPQQGETDGKSSRFTATHDDLAKEGLFKGFIRGKADKPIDAPFKEQKKK